MPASAVAKRDPSTLTWEEFTASHPWDKFAQRTLENGLNDRAAMMIASYGEKGSGLTGKVQQLYRCLFFCLQAGPAEPRADQD